MSLGRVLGGLETGDAVTFNDSGNANAHATDELVVTLTGMDFEGITVEFEETISGDLWRVRHVDAEDEFVIEYDKVESHHPNDEPIWRRFDVVETVELVGEAD